MMVRAKSNQTTNTSEQPLSVLIASLLTRQAIVAVMLAPVLAFFSVAMLPSSVTPSAKAVYGLKVLLLAILLNVISSFPVFQRIIGTFLPRTGETALTKLGKILLANIKTVKKQYAVPINDHVVETANKTKQLWKSFGPMFTEIPEKGMREEELIELVDNIYKRIETGVLKEDLSGAIYMYGYKQPRVRDNHPAVTQYTSVIRRKSKTSKTDEWTDLVSSLERLYGHAFARAYLWNSLHEGEFGVGYWLIYQVVRMVGELFGGKPQETMGQITTGGTDSLMNMVRMYREWGRENKHQDIGQATIIACESVHAAVDKGCIAYDVKLIKIPYDSNKGAMSLKHLRRAVAMHSTNLVAIICSAPGYSLGVVDSVPEIAEIAKAAGVGLHVDCCLGGFIINFLPDFNNERFTTRFFEIDGVTSISCDTHKNGWAPKGSSVLLTGMIDDEIFGRVNLSYYSVYAIPDWDGGVYGTPSNPGSQHVTHVLQAYVALLRIGKEGYKNIAMAVNNTVNDCIEILKRDKRIEVIGEHTVGAINATRGVNLIGFKVASSAGWGFGASYALAHEMHKYKMTCSAIKGDKLHFAVTGRSALDPKFLARFETAVRGAIEAVERIARDVQDGKTQFSGDAGLYGTLDSAMKPTSTNTKSTEEYLGNLILGKKTATDLVRSHFYALQDPYRGEPLVLLDYNPNQHDAVAKDTSSFNTKGKQVLDHVIEHVPEELERTKEFVHLPEMEEGRDYLPDLDKLIVDLKHRMKEAPGRVEEEV